MQAELHEFLQQREHETNGTLALMRALPSRSGPAIQTLREPGTMWRGISSCPGPTVSDDRNGIQVFERFTRSAPLAPSVRHWPLPR